MKKIEPLLPLFGFFILLALYEVCDFFVKKFSIPFPGALLAMIIMFALLSFKIIPIRLVEGACKKLLEHMPLYFVPILVGIAAYKSLLEGKVIPIFLSVSISGVLTLVLTGVCVEFLHKRRLAKYAIKNAEAKNSDDQIDK